MMPFAAMRLRAEVAGPPPGAFATYDPANKYSTISLTESNMRASATEGGGFRTAYGTGAKSHAAGTSYAVEFEIMVADILVGIGTVGGSTNPSDPGDGASFGRFSIYSAYGQAFKPSFTSGFASYGVGDRIGFKAAPISGSWEVSMFKNGALITTGVIVDTLQVLPCFMTYFSASASARLHTDPADMTYFADYVADDGWTE